jgi:copper transport protein
MTTPLSPRRLLAALLVALVSVPLVLGMASSADAHALLLSIDPADGSVLESAPDAVRLTFNEPVEVPTGGVRVFDGAAERVDDGVARQVEPSVVELPLPAGLPDGGYVVTYRVISADSHPIAGVSTFVVGEGEVEDDLVGAVTGGDDRVAGALVDAARWASYLAVLLAAGAYAFARTVAGNRAERLLARRVGVPAALVGLGVVLLSIPIQAMALGGDGLRSALDVAVLADVVGSSFGTGAVLRLVGLGVLTVLWLAGAPWLATGTGALAAVASFALDGHQRSVDPAWLLIGADVMHLAAAAWWFAGLVLLTLVVRARRLEDDAVGAARLIARFSTGALVSVAVLAVAGVAMAVPLVGTPSALTSTTYGWLLVAKTAATLVVVAVAAFNRQRLVPAITAMRVPAGGSADTTASGAGSTDDLQAGGDEARIIRRTERASAAWTRLRRTLHVEVGVLVLVLGLTGVLVGTQPASEAAGLTGYYEVTSSLDEGLELDLVVDPNQAGRNTIHLYVLDENGRPATGAQDLMLELTYAPQGIGPIPIEPFFAGTGHWIATVDDLAFAGDWDVRVVVGIDRFTETTTTVTVPVAP